MATESVTFQAEATPGPVQGIAFPEGTKIKATAPDGSIVEWEITGAERGGTFSNHVDGWETSRIVLHLKRDL